MPVTASCPEVQAFKDLLHDRLQPAEAERLYQHLETCSHCGETVEQLIADDPLARIAASLSPADQQPEGEVVTRLIERLHKLPQATLAQTFDSNSDPSHAEAPAKPEATTELYALLAPAQGPDEMGRLGAYRVLKVLGAGGMGVVFQAEDPQLKRLVALKAMKPALVSQLARQRFLREAQATAAIKHDHIVTIYQVGEDRGVPFLAMELLQGEPLDHWLDRGRKPTIPQVLRMGREIARGLRAAHEQGLIHRDIKPGNIWLEVPIGRVKILDFGLARGTDDNAHLTQSGMVLGTPAFMSPEQANARPADPRSDLFSLGSVLYRLLAGQLPFHGKDAMSMFFAVAMGDARPLREVNPAVPPELADLVMQLLAREPADRPQSAKVVVETLQRIERNLTSSGQPTASPPGAIPIAVPVQAEASPFQQLTEASSKIVQPPSQPARSRGGRRLPWRIAAAVVLLGVIGVLAAPIIIRLKNKDGSETEIKVPDGTTVIVEKGGKVIATVPPEVPPLRVAASPLDALDPARIPAAERFAWQPKELVAVLGEHRQRHWGEVFSVVYSPDGKLIASGGGDRVIRLWDAATMRERFVLRGHHGAVYAVAFAPDGKTLASGSDDYTVRLWDLAGEQPREGIVFAGHTRWVYAVAFSPDGKTLASGSWDKTVRLWDLTAGRPKERAVLTGHTAPVRALAISLDGKLLASGSEDTTVRLWDLTGADARQVAVLQGHTNWVNAVAFAPDGKTLASGSQDHTVRLWHASGEKPKQKAVLELGGVVRAVAFAPDGKTLAVGGYLNGVQLWRLSGEKPEVQAVLTGHKRGLYAVAFSPDGKTLASSSADMTVRLWDLAGEQPKERPVIQGPATELYAAAFAPDGKTLAMGGYSDIRLWDLTGTLPRERGVPIGDVHAVSFGADTKTLTYMSKFSVGLWDLTRWQSKTLKGLPTQNRQHVPMAIAPDGKTVASGSDDKTVRLFKLAQEQPAPMVALQGHNDQVRTVAFAPDGKTLASGGRDKTVRLWNLTGAEVKERAVLQHTGGVYTVAFAPDGKTLASGCHDGTVRLWDLTRDKVTERARFNGHTDEVRTVAFSPDGKTLAAAALDGRILLWTVASGRKVREWQYPGKVDRLAFSPDGRYLVTANGNGTAYVLRLSPAPAVAQPK